MGRKRNVDAENHLMTGGLITGFLTFMGFMPGAAAGAAITGAVVGKDIKKAKKEEAFKRDFASHEERLKEFNKKWYEIDRLLDKFVVFDPEFYNFKYQDALEESFLNAERVARFDRTRKNLNSIDTKELINKSLNANNEDKMIEQYSDDSCTKTYIVKEGNVYYYCSFTAQYPYRFREKCKKAGIPFKKYGYAELQEFRQKLHYKLYEPYKFNFTKYH